MASPDPSRFVGSLLGTMVGDCLGLPREGLSARRAEMLFGSDVGCRFLGRRGMASDDTELACFAAQAFLSSKGEPEPFARDLGWKLRWWFLAGPAGLGLATLRCCLKLWLGWPASKSGVWSAGNGAAIRGPVLGVACWDDETKLRALVRASTIVSHTDPKAERGAMAVALAARYAATHARDDFRVSVVLDLLRPLFPTEDQEGQKWFSLLEQSLSKKGTSVDFASAIGAREGVSGYVYQTVPAVLHVWLSAPHDFKAGMQSIIRLGGDSDTTAAIFGGICGAAVGVEGIPQDWLDGIIEFPRSAAWVRSLAQALHRCSVSKDAAASPSLAWPLIPLRNLFFVCLVLLHEARRALPPY